MKKIKILLLLSNSFIVYPRVQHILRCIFNLLRAPSSHAKFIFPWLNSLLSEGDAFGNDVPWMTFEVLEWLESYLSPNKLIFEYGSGGSTIFISKRVKKIISVEHDKNWYHHVLNKMKWENVTNCALLLRQPECDSLGKEDYSNPRSYLSANPRYSGMNFKRYARCIEKFPDEYFDLVIVDGRARPSCIYSARRKIRPNGYLLLDDSDREHYNRCRVALKDWQAEKHYGLKIGRLGFVETLIWKKKVV